jgi:endonuclease/exonuclease/phosphatase family metal-dependent hydrolase
VGAACRRAAVVTVIASCVLAPQARALRILNYNILNYPGSTAPARDPQFRTIIGPIAPDVLVVQEMTSQTGVNGFLNNVLNVLEPGQWVAAAFTNGNDSDNACFYKPSKVTLVGASSFYPSATNLRLVNMYRIRPVGYTAAAAEIRIFTCHLKASQGFETDRFNEAVGIRDTMNLMPAGTHAILTGDLNIYTSTEPAYQRFLANLADNDGRLYDPLNSPGDWNNNPAFAAIHTQSPCNNNCVPGLGQATGGMDDRFDQVLPTLNMNNGTGLEVLAATYKAVGNDGLHFNNDINDPPVIPEGQAYANALNGVSDHLPLRVDVQLPAEVQASPAMVAFGTVIVGAPAPQQSIAMTNPAVAPADDLDYTLAASAGFTAPGGTFAIDPGAAALMHTLSMSAATAGAKSGTLTITSDSADQPSLGVPLAGTVLRHAVAALGAGGQQMVTVDFGDHQAGAFTDQPTAVYNLGFDALQARLALASGTITGGGGRFSIVGGFSPTLVGATPQGYTLHFDDTNFGGTTDSTVTAALTFQSGDEALPGAAAQPDLVVTLRAKVLVPTDATASLPTVTRLFSPFPNPPLHAGTTLRFDLAQPSDVRLDVFDVAGRQVASLAAAGFVRGSHAVRWDGRGDDGEQLGSGVYFVRLSGRDIAAQTVRVTLLR